MDESALIKQAQRGDVRAFNTLVLHYQDHLYNFAYRLTHDPATAEDATQEAFIAAYQALNRFHGGSFRAWLFRILRNKCFDALRKDRRHPEPSLDNITDSFETPRILASDGASPERAHEQAELWRAIEACLERLPPDQRETVVLRDIEEYEYNEIAHILTISLGTVKSRLSRARARLQSCLQEKMELLPAAYRFINET